MPDKLPFLPDEHHYAITHVVARAAQLDHALYYTADTQLLPFREASKFIIDTLDLNRTVSLIHALLRDNFPSRHAEIDDLIQNIKTMRKERNELLHWLWRKTDDPETIELGTFKPYKSTPTKTKTAQELYELAQSMLKASLALDRLNDDHSNQLGLQKLRVYYGTPSPDKLAPQVPPEHLASPENQDRPRGVGLLDLPPPPSPEKSE